MHTKRSIICAMTLIFVLAGCGQKAKQEELRQQELASQSLVELVESPKLAKLILKPEGEKLKVKRDPFAPLSAKFYDKETPVIFQQDVQELLKNIQYYGYVKINQEYSALLKINNEKGVFNINDKVDDLTIMDIHQDYIVLKNGTKTYTLERGGK